MKHKVYTIEYGKFWIEGDDYFVECKNQPSFLDIDKANEELASYLKQSDLFFVNNEEYKKVQYKEGYYIELYENEVELTEKEIKDIEEEFDYPDGTSLTAPIKTIYIDNSYNFNPFKGYNWGSL